MSMVKIVKNLYTRLYIYAKRAAVMHKYTAVTVVFGDVIFGISGQTRTIFEASGGLSEHREG